MTAAVAPRAPAGLAQIFPFPIDVQNEEYIVLRDSSGQRHHVCKRAAIQSPVLKLMEISGDVPLDVSTEVMEVLVAYMYYKLRYGPHTIGSAKATSPPFFDRVTPDMALAVAEAARKLRL